MKDEEAPMKVTESFRKLDMMLRSAEVERKCLIADDPGVYELARRYMDSGFLVRPFPSMFMKAETWKALEARPRQRWRYVQDAYKAAHPDETLCSFSAALEYGLWVSKRQLGTMHIVVPVRSKARRSTYIHRHYCPQGELDELEGVKVTTLMRTVLDCCLEGSFSDGLAIADSALRFCGLDLDGFRSYVAKAASKRAGADKARAVARYADGGSENAGESIVRARIIELGYMAPTGLQVELPDPVEGGKTIRVDIYYVLPDGNAVIVEVDGMEKYGTGNRTKDALVRERQRESHITALGVPVMRVLFQRVHEPGYLENLLDSYRIPKAR